MKTKARFTSLLVLASALGLLSGCASLQSVSVTAVPQDRSRVVEADEGNVAFLGIHFDNSFADGLRDKLKAQCPRGKVTGIYTKYETVWYFLVQKRKVSASGFCVGADAPVPAPQTEVQADSRPSAKEGHGGSS
jgi:hypothetical protein